MKKFEGTLVRLLPLSLLLIFFVSSAYGDVTPTNEWISLYSYNTQLNGKAIPVGALIDAYDPDAVHCGRFIVSAEGQFGFMPVYRDDFTSGEDEGCDPGDIITLRINGLLAATRGAEEVIWGGNGETIEADLAINDVAIGVDINGPSSGSGTPGEYTYYSLWTVNMGDGIDFYNLDVMSANGWTVEIVGSETSDYINPSDSAEIVVRVMVPPGAEDDDTDDITLTAVSAMDDMVSASHVVQTQLPSSAADEYNAFVPGVFKLYQNYPNPFNPTTTIEFSLERAGNISLEIFNVLGQRIATLAEGYHSSGAYEFEWDGRTDSGEPVSSGIYFYRLTSDDVSRTQKMMLMK